MLNKGSPVSLDTECYYPSEKILRQRFEQSAAKEEMLKYLKRTGTSVDVLFSWDGNGGRRGLLSDLGILRHMVAGNVVIYPFDNRLLQPHGYDVRLGENYYRLRDWKDGIGWFTAMLMVHLYEFIPSYNPYSERDVSYLWEGPIRSRLTKEQPFVPKNVLERMGYRIAKLDKLQDIVVSSPDFDNVGDNDLVIPMRPGEMLLGHTQEFIGGRNVISTRISGRSSIGRSMIEVCSDANLGVTGFINRWTLELTNKSTTRRINLIVGEPVATIQFEEMGPSLATYHGNYQDSSDLEDLSRRWSPTSMLPKLKRLGDVR